MIYRLEDKAAVKPFFKDWQETLIWSALEDIMGTVYADDRDNPTCAMITLGDFSFVAGVSNTELVSYKPIDTVQDFMIIVPQNESWNKAIEESYKGKAKKTKRYAIKKEPNIFDKQKLCRAAADLPQGYSLQLIDRALYNTCMHTDWCKDFVAQYPTYTAFCKGGIGVVCMYNGQIAAGASSYSHYDKGIEIEIITHKAHRRKGLAYACGAALILECMARGLYPSWDARTKTSVALAEKLGYQYSHTYTAYEICGW